MNLWELHQSWKSARVEDVRILHAFKRQKTVFRGNLVRAKKIPQMPEDLAGKEVGQKTKTSRAKRRMFNKETQTDDERMDGYMKKCEASSQKGRRS